MCCLAFPLFCRRYSHTTQILAIDAVEIGPQQMIRQIPTRHIAHRFLPVHDLASLVEVCPSMCAHGEWPLQLVISLEERERIPTRYNACALIVQER